MPRLQQCVIPHKTAKKPRRTDVNHPKNWNTNGLLHTEKRILNPVKQGFYSMQPSPKAGTTPETSQKNWEHRS